MDSSPTSSAPQGPQPSTPPGPPVRHLPSRSGRLVAHGLMTVARLLTGVRSLWTGCSPTPKQRVYFANHSSHTDFLLLWTSLPPELRRITRPVAGADYWQASALRRFIIHKAFNGVLVARHAAPSERSPAPDAPLQPSPALQTLLDALQQGDSLIIFPEGTRNTEPGLLPFKSGIYHLARAFPQVEFVPVWLENLNRVMPKGQIIPLPVLCSVTFGEPLGPKPDEPKEAFLARAREALLKLNPHPEN